MTATFSVPVHFESGDADELRAVPTSLLNLDYSCSKAPEGQTVTRERVLLQPDIDFADYRFRAEIDWIELGFATDRAHQAMNICNKVNRELASAGFRDDSYVSGIERKPGYSGQHFLVRINAPTPLKLHFACMALRNNYAVQPYFEGDSFLVMGVEIAVDIYPDLDELDPWDRILALWKMSEVLRKHLYVNPFFLEDPRDHPRVFYRRNGSDKTAKLIERRRVLPRSEAELLGSKARNLESLALVPDNHFKPPLDGTVYVGAKEKPFLLRLQDKINDSHGQSGSGRTLLEANMRRSRIEVRVEQSVSSPYELETCNGLHFPKRDNHDEWRAVVLRGVSDLHRFDFEWLRRLFFDFRLPTLKPGDRGKRLSLDPDEATIFKASGCFGLGQAHRGMRELERRQHRRKGYGKKGRPPRALGPKGHMVAFETMNERTRKALLRLSSEWQTFDWPKDRGTLIGQW